MTNTITLYVKGMASTKILRAIQLTPNDFKEMTLLDFLTAQGITVASSCAGLGKCRKCIVNNDLLSCQISLKHFLENYPQHTIEIAYL